MNNVLNKILTSSIFTTQNQRPAEMLSTSNSAGLIIIQIKTHQDPRVLLLAQDFFPDLYNAQVVKPPILQARTPYYMRGQLSPTGTYSSLFFCESYSIVQSVFSSTLALFVLTFGGTFYECHNLFIRTIAFDDCSH